MLIPVAIFTHNASCLWSVLCYGHFMKYEVNNLTPGSAWRWSIYTQLDCRRWAAGDCNQEWEQARGVKKCETGLMSFQSALHIWNFLWKREAGSKNRGVIRMIDHMDILMFQIGINKLVWLHQCCIVTTFTPSSGRLMQIYTISLFSFTNAFFDKSLSLSFLIFFGTLFSNINRQF